MSTPDYRAALVKLVEAVDRLLSQGESPANPGSRLILTVHVEDLGALADRARNLLAAPEVVGVTDEELFDLWNSEGNEADFQDCRRFARAVLARYGTAHPAPVPVGERLPGVEDLDVEGTCWCWHSVMHTWGLFRFDSTAHSHWLPHWALPLPEAQP
jgi:hypothetical protein